MVKKEERENICTKGYVKAVRNVNEEKNIATVRRRGGRRKGSGGAGWGEWE